MGLACFVLDRPMLPAVCDQPVIPSLVVLLGVRSGSASAATTDATLSRTWYSGASSHGGYLVGHTGTATTQLVYRKQIRPVVTGGAQVMDSLFPRQGTDA